ncbi:MAG: polyphosphate kinase [Reyranella sp.]|uniref:polyphosphate kinase 2 family protein n=1 Tax=Reyranella sp. TaxID=1929291 RepID=UPI001ACDC357|nr:polyphosphate kinase [Reyranella sp.]MBN9089644.1 polyphosphate kinase [Reyranella sp.]
MSKWPVLDKIKLIDSSLTDEEYERRLKKLQNQLLDLQVHHLRTGGRAIIGIDGWDAAGKGGLIQRLVFGLEPRSVQVWRIGAPTPEEQGKHFLWRFWDRVPAPRNWAIFDRTWYGRVLVERIEGFCSKAEWQRAYDEINEFEKTLADSGVRFVKLLVHVSEEEQKKRMISRLEKPHKRYKVGVEDFRNIAKRKQYLEAYKDMLDKTDTDHAPWHVIATDDKRHERLAGLEIVVDILGRGVKIAPQELDPEVAAGAFKLWGWKPKKDEK